jgi:cobalt-zinc-cadmium efflux system protein
MSKERRLLIVVLLNLGLVVALVAVGLFAHSLGVLAAGADYLGDAIGAGISLAAIRLSPKHPRATAYAALVNASFLFLVSVVVLLAALRRLFEGAPEVHGLPVLIVSAIAAAVMVLGALILGRSDPGDFNMRSVMLDTVADAAAAAGVAISGAIILIADGIYWLDSAVAGGIALTVGYHAQKLVREVLRDLRSAQEP